MRRFVSSESVSVDSAATLFFQIPKKYALFFSNTKEYCAHTQNDVYSLGVKRAVVSLDFDFLH